MMNCFKGCRVKILFLVWSLFDDLLYFSIFCFFMYLKMQRKEETKTKTCMVSIKFIEKHKTKIKWLLNTETTINCLKETISLDALLCFKLEMYIRTE